MNKLTHTTPCTSRLCTHTCVGTHTHTCTHCAGYIPYPVSPGGRPLKWGATGVGGDMYSCPPPSPNTPAHTEKRDRDKSVSVEGML